MAESSRYQAILSAVTQLPVIDTHEHLAWREEPRAADNNDVLKEYLIHYLRCDLISAGLSPADQQRATDASLPILERWNLVEPYWEASRFTGYGRALDIAAKGIYGIDGVRRETIVELNDAFQKQSAPGHYAHVLRDLCGIKVSLLDAGPPILEGENPLFQRVWRPEWFIAPGGRWARWMLEDIKKRLDMEIHSLDDWMEAAERTMDLVLEQYRSRILKIGLAYQRPLRFEKVEYSAARGAFAQSLSQWRRTDIEENSLRMAREAEDFMMHHILKLASARHLTIQFHTGLQEGNGNTLSNSDPALLNNLFMEYPDVDFDLFHISYPFQGVACALSKNFANVYLDMCWAHIISPNASRAALSEFLDAVPYNKISAFGGDYVLVDGVYGHLALARENVSRVLAEKIELGVFGEEKAIDIARALFYDNPNRIFKLGL